MACSTVHTWPCHYGDSTWPAVLYTPGRVVIMGIVHGLLRLRAGVILFTAVLDVAVVIAVIDPQAAAVTVVGGVTPAPPATSTNTSPGGRQGGGGELSRGVWWLISARCDSAAGHLKRRRYSVAHGVTV